MSSKLKEAKLVPNFSEIEPVQFGDKYEWTKTVSCRSGAIQEEGSIIEVLDSTRTCAWGEISESGWNWICRTADGLVSEWSTLEQCISRGVLRKVE
jgi:hypothetical protein